MLFLKECRKILFSITFIIYIAALFGDYFTQFAADAERMEFMPPLPGTGDYGTIEKEVPEVLMPNAAENLVREYLAGYYVAYPVGFYKEVRLSEKKSEQMADIITEITGIEKQELDSFDYPEDGGIVWEKDENGEDIAVICEPEIFEINIPESMTYEHFRELMKQADKLIGGGSEYSDGFIVESFSQIPMTYEEALEEYNDLMEKDKITGAFARLFCDYAGIAVSVLPAFAAAAFVISDKKSRMQQLIYSKKISSSRLVMTRFAALTAMLSIPVLIIAVIAAFSITAKYPENTDFLAIPAMAIVWLLPNIMFSAALGMLVTEISSPLPAVLIQGIIWFVCIMKCGLVGDIGKFTLICRHNSVYDRAAFMANLNDFIFSRVFYAVIALAFAMLAALVYDYKRKGDICGGIKNIVRKSEA